MNIYFSNVLFVKERPAKSMLYVYIRFNRVYTVFFEKNVVFKIPLWLFLKITSIVKK